MKVRSEVKAFSEIMEQKLKENDHKSHWGNLENSWLIGRLKDELKELENAIYKAPSQDAEWQEKLDIELQRECADIANFAMMIADNVKKL